MKGNKTNIFYPFTIIVLYFFFNSISSDYVNTLLNKNEFFSSNSEQKQIDVNFNSEKENLKKYTLWGWLKNSGEKDGIINFLILKQKISKNFDSSNNLNDKFIKCPASQSEIKANPALKNEPEIYNNPNCFIDTENNEEDENPIFDYLYINYDLNPGLNKYSIVFLIQNGIKMTKSEMKIDGFSDLNFFRNSWVFFALSLDYISGTGVIHIKELTKNKNNNTKSIKLNFPDFELEKNNSIILANREPVEYYKTDTFFVGNLGYIEIAPFFTEKVDNLWMGFMETQSLKYNGILMELIFNIYDSNQELNSKGEIQKKIKINGNFTPLYKEDKMKSGIRMKNNSFLELKDIDFEIKEDIKPLLFFFDLKYTEQLTNNFILLERGRKGENGYLVIHLIKKDNGRILKLNAVGHNNKINWKSDLLKENEILSFIIGIVISPSNAVRIAYYDSNNNINTDFLDDNFDFHYQRKNISLFKNTSSKNDNSGSIEVYRFFIMNSASSIILKELMKNNKKILFKNSENCNLVTDYYNKNSLCLRCNSDFVLTNEKKCEKHCPNNFKNVLNNICVECLKNKCEELPLSNWRIQKVSNDNYKLIPPTKLNNGDKINFNEVFEVLVNGENKTKGDFDYESKYNSIENSINYEFDFNKKKTNKHMLEFNYLKSQQKLYDINKNLIPDLNIKIKSETVCSLSQNKKNALHGFAITILVIFLLTFIFLILFTIFLRKKINYISLYWKLFLHTWMNFQLLTFFLFLGIKIPCCLREFLHVLYLVTVKWDYALRPLIDYTNNSDTYDEGILMSQPDYIEFRNENVEGFLLHNMGVLFIFILLFKAVYIVIKFFSFFKKYKKWKDYLVYFDFTGLVICLMTFHMHLYVFTIINLKFAIFTNFYFIKEFFSTMVLILMIVIFFLYLSFRLIKGGVYFTDKINKKKYAYFFSGIISRQWYITFDMIRLFIHFIIAILIATSWENYLFQTISIFLLFLILLVFAILMRPWIYKIQTIWEIISLVCLLCISIIFLIIASFDSKGCYECGDREGAVCWFFIIFIFFISVGGCLFLVGMLLLAYLKPQNLIEKEYIDNFGEEVQKKNDKSNQLINKVLNKNNRSFHSFKSNISINKSNAENENLAYDDRDFEFQNKNKSNTDYDNINDNKSNNDFDMNYNKSNNDFDMNYNRSNNDFEMNYNRSKNDFDMNHNRSNNHFDMNYNKSNNDFDMDYNRSNNNINNRQQRNNFDNNNHEGVPNYNNNYQNNQNHNNFQNQKNYKSISDNSDIDFYERQVFNQKNNHSIQNKNSNHYNNLENNNNLIPDDADEGNLQTGVLNTLINYEGEEEKLDYETYNNFQARNKIAYKNNNHNMDYNKNQKHNNYYHEREEDFSNFDKSDVDFFKPDKSDVVFKKGKDDGYRKYKDQSDFF